MPPRFVVSVLRHQSELSLVMAALFFAASGYAALAASLFPPEIRPHPMLPLMVSLVNLGIGLVLLLRGRKLRLASAAWLCCVLLAFILLLVMTSVNLSRATVAGMLAVAVLTFFAWFMPSWAGRVVSYTSLGVFAAMVAIRYPTNDAYLTVIALVSLAVLLTEIFGRFKRKLQQVSLTDHLCNVWNRRGFELLLQKEIRTVARTGEPLALVYIDLDGFKKVNDEGGHSAGDLVLQGVSRGLLSSLRGGDSVARVGGDEFVLLLPRTNLAAAMTLLDRLRREVTGSLWSAGVAEYQAGESADELTERADAAMLHQKRAHRM